MPDKKYIESIKQKKPFDFKEEKEKIGDYVKKESRDKNEYKLMQCRIIQEPFP